MENKIGFAGALFLSLVVSFSVLSAHAAPKAKNRDGGAQTQRDQSARDQAPREYAPPRDNFNLTFEPLFAIVGYIQGEAAYRIGDQFTVGLAFDYWNLEIGSIGLVASAIGPSVKWYPSGAMRDSFYLHGQVQTTHSEASAKDSLGTKYSSAVNGTLLKIALGYHWFWSSFNLNLGLSKSTYSYSSIDIVDSNGNKLDSYTPNDAFPELQIGFTF